MARSQQAVFLQTYLTDAIAEEVLKHGAHNQKAHGRRGRGGKGPMTGAVAPADPLPALVRARRGLELVDLHDSSTSTMWLTFRIIPRMAGLSFCSTVF